MAEYRTVKKGTYRDPFMLSLKPEERLLYLWLFTNDYVNTAGIQEVNEEIIRFETGIGYPMHTLCILYDKNKVIIDGDHVWVRNFVKLQFKTINEKIEKAIIKCLSGCTSEIILYEFGQTYSEIPYAYPMHTPSISNDTLCKDLGTLVPKRKRAIAATNVPAIYLELSQSFLEQQRERFPNESVWEDFEALISAGAKSLHLFHTKNGWTEDKIRNLLSLIPESEFWSRNQKTLGSIRKRVQGKGTPMKFENAYSDLVKENGESVPGSILTYDQMLIEIDKEQLTTDDFQRLGNDRWKRK